VRESARSPACQDSVAQSRSYFVASAAVGAMGDDDGDGDDDDSGVADGGDGKSMD